MGFVAGIVMHIKVSNTFLSRLAPTCPLPRCIAHENDTYFGATFTGAAVSTNTLELANDSSSSATLV